MKESELRKIERFRFGVDAMEVLEKIICKIDE